MNEIKLKRLLIEDLTTIGVPTDFNLNIKGYSKCYNGLYNPRKREVVIYAKEENGEFRDYNILLMTALHEATHHFQYNYQKGFKRVKGVMHSPTFYSIYNTYTQKARKINLLSEGDLQNEL